MRQYCQICGKPIKENTQGNPKYCQGHSQSAKYDHCIADQADKDYRESEAERLYNY